MLRAISTLLTVAVVAVGASAAAAAPPSTVAAPALVTSVTPAQAAAPASAAADQAAATPALAEVDDSEAGGVLLPVAGSAGSEEVDWLFTVLMYLALFGFVAITLCVVVMVAKYRRREGVVPESSSSNNDVLELAWIAVPAVIAIAVFVWGWKGYLDLTTPPKRAMTIAVSANIDGFSFDHSKGEKVLTRSELHVPLNKPVRLVMKSTDVIHALAIPAFRTKFDVLPDRFTEVWFEASRPGTYRLFCAEYCGARHASMRTQVVVHEAGQYEAWLDGELKKEQPSCEDAGSPEAMEECYASRGQELYTTLGCMACHTLDGTPTAGPSFKGIYGEDRKFTDGSTGTVDDAYIRESVLAPTAKVRDGFPPAMPPFEGRVSDDDIKALTAFIKAQK